MGADWYNAFSFFGYEITVPSDTTYPKFVNRLFGPSSILEEPFTITGILTEFHSRMDETSDAELAQLNEHAHIVIGFYPVNDLAKMVKLGHSLTEYIVDNPILKGLEIAKTPRFYAGIEWFVDIYEETSDDSDNSDEDDDDDGDDCEDDDTSDEDELKIAPERKPKCD
jgi:hypothetical protein